MVLGCSRSRESKLLDCKLAWQDGGGGFSSNDLGIGYSLDMVAEAISSIKNAYTTRRYDNSQGTPRHFYLQKNVRFIV
jgi:hypothetical protein